MNLDFTVVLATFLPLLLLELPDKTFVATLVLSTRFRPLYAWIGAGLAFGVQCVVAVAAGGLLSRLPRTPVLIAAAVLFAVFAVILWRTAGQSDEPENPEDVAAETNIPVWKAIGTSFLTVFLAEWGDLSQLFVAGLSARFASPLSVFIGAWAALLLIAGLAALVGRALVAKLKLSLIRRLGAIACAILAVLTTLELLA